MTPDAPPGRTIESRKDDTPEGAAQREELRTAIELKDYEFNAHGVELGQRYRSAAVIPDGTPEPAFAQDPELYDHPTTWPGTRIPHCWLTRGSKTVSTLDLVGKGRFTLLTGIGGDAWVKAAQSVSEQLGVPIEPLVIGPGHELEDLYGDWSRVREIPDDGCLLIRPDQHIAYRAFEQPDQPTEALRQALSTVLSR